MYMGHIALIITLLLKRLGVVQVLTESKVSAWPGEVTPYSDAYAVLVYGASCVNEFT